MKACRYVIITLFILLASAALGEPEQPQPSAAQAESKAAGKASGAHVVTLDLKDVPVQYAIDALFAGSGRVYAIEPGVSGTVSIKLSGVPFDNALRTLANTAGLAVREDKGLIILGLDPQRGLTNIAQPTTQEVQWQWSPSQRAVTTSQRMPVPPGVVNIQPRRTGTGFDRRFDVTLEQANVFEAIKQLMELDGRDYVLDLGVSNQMSSVFGLRITAKLKNATLDDVLNALAKTPGLTIEKAANIYVIGFHGYPGYSTAYAGPSGPPLFGSAERGVPILSCTNCGQSLQPDWRFCPMCGIPANYPGADKK